MLHSVQPLSIIISPIREVHQSIAMSFVVFVLTLVLVPETRFVNTLSVFFALTPKPSIRIVV